MSFHLFTRDFIFGHHLGTFEIKDQISEKKQQPKKKKKQTKKQNPNSNQKTVWKLCAKQRNKKDEYQQSTTKINGVKL